MPTDYEEIVRRRHDHLDELREMEEAAREEAESEEAEQEQQPQTV